MTNKILLKRNTTTGRDPSANDLSIGELALNTADQKIFFKHTNNTVHHIQALYSASIDELFDVDTSTSSPTADQVLSWNSLQSKWAPRSVSDPITLVQLDQSSASVLTIDSVSNFRFDNEFQLTDLGNGTAKISLQSIEVDANGDVTVSGDLSITGDLIVNGTSVGFGYTGSRGDLGYTGSLGYHGSTGYTGSEGESSFSWGSDPPQNPEIGDRWFDTVKGALTVYVDDGTSLQWVEISASGFIGQQGYTGSQGPAGGYTGSRGDQGFTGSQGDIGFTGSEGVGFTGSQGDTGYTGSQGDLGYSGSVGNTGFTGSQGDVGFTGSKGDLGFTGSRGLPGYTGSQGELGYTGSQGEIGYTGSQGNLGYTGSQGDVGYTGSIGYTGSQGDVGYTGSQGDVGFTGSQGIQGEAAAIGYTGSQGDLGYTGSQGDVGYTGSQGDVGYTGSQGDAGYVGSKGDAGDLNDISGISENFQTISNAASIVVHDTAVSNNFLHISPTSSWTVNFTNVVGTDDRTRVLSLIILQDNSPFVPTEIQIDGQTQSIYWSNGTLPVATSNGIDLISFNLIRDGATWYILGQSSSYYIP